VYKCKKKRIFAISMVKIKDIELGEFPLLLAPMEDVSDPPFRALCKKYGADMMYTEFISSEGLIRDARKSVQKLDIYPYERPIGIQIFGANKESMIRTAEIVEEAQPEVLDINYGCPVKKVVCKMAGAGILQDIDKMVDLTKTIVNATSLPVTVKTRLGWDDNTKYIVEVAERLQDIGIHAISIHGRTRKQMYKGEADWTLIGKIKDNPRMHIPVFGNGDVNSGPKALEMKNKYGVDGIMIGRASIGYPWIFREVKHYLKTGEEMAPASIQERVDAARDHLTHSIDWKGERLGILEMRRHYTSYFRGLPNIREKRMKLVTTDEPNELFDIIETIREEYADYKFFSDAEKKAQLAQ